MKSVQLLVMLLAVVISLGAQEVLHTMYQKSYKLGLHDRTIFFQKIGDCLKLTVHTGFNEQAMFLEAEGSLVGTQEVIVSQDAENYIKIVIHPEHLLVAGASRYLQAHKDGFIDEFDQYIHGKTLIIPLGFTVSPESVMSSFADGVLEVAIDLVKET